jgi:DNA-directed RNA polymerase specialized sigma24 family protein
MNDDATLVERAVAGDREAFAALYELYFDSVYDFLARMVRDQAQAADLAQDTFLRAMHSLSWCELQELDLHDRPQYGAQPDRAVEADTAPGVG